MAKSIFTAMALTIAAGTAAGQGGPTEAVQEQLDAVKEAFLKKAPKETAELYERGIEEVGKSGVMERAKKAGDQAPDFALATPDASRTVDLTGLLRQGPVVLTWYRGGWCPYCMVAMKGLDARLDDFREAGATVVALTPETPENAAATAEKNGLKMLVLSDIGNKVARRYGIAFELPADVASNYKQFFDLRKYNGDDTNVLPLAATYVIDRDGTIRYAFADADYRKRAEPAEVLAAVKKLSGN